MFPSPWSKDQFAFDVHGLKFAFFNPDPQFVLTDPGFKFLFACSLFYSKSLLHSGLSLSRKGPINLFEIEKVRDRENYQIFY